MDPDIEVCRPVCRICLEEDSVENLIRPCDCRGSMEHVHAACLSTWILECGQKLGDARLLPDALAEMQCEVCRGPYRARAIVSLHCRLPPRQHLPLMTVVVLGMLFLVAFDVLIACAMWTALADLPHHTATAWVTVLYIVLAIIAIGALFVFSCLAIADGVRHVRARWLNATARIEFTAPV